MLPKVDEVYSLILTISRSWKSRRNRLVTTMGNTDQVRIVVGRQVVGTDVLRVKFNSRVVDDHGGESLPCTSHFFSLEPQICEAMVRTKKIIGQ